MKNLSIALLTIIALLALNAYAQNNNANDSSVPTNTPDQTKSSGQAYSFSVTIPYYNESTEEISSIFSNMNLIFMPNGKVMWTASTLLGYDVPMGVGSYDEKTNTITFNHDRKLNNMAHLLHNPRMILRNEDGYTSMSLSVLDRKIGPGGWDFIDNLFNGNTYFVMSPTTYTTLNPLVGTVWQVEGGGPLEFISNYEVKINNKKICPYFYNNGKLAITTDDNPIEGEAVVGDYTGGNIITFQGDGVISSFNNAKVFAQKIK